MRRETPIGGYEADQLNTLLLYLIHRFESSTANYEHRLAPEKRDPETPFLRHKLWVLLELLHMPRWGTARRILNPFSPLGARIRFRNATTVNSFDYKHYLQACDHLTPDAVYTIQSIIAEEPLCYIELLEHPGLRFNGCLFVEAEPVVSEDAELLALYGMQLASDCMHVQQMLEEMKNLPEPTPMERITMLKDDVRRFPGIIAGIREVADELLCLEVGDQPHYEPGRRFDDGTRTTEVLRAELVQRI